MNPHSACTSDSSTSFRSSPFPISLHGQICDVYMYVLLSCFLLFFYPFWVLRRSDTYGVLCVTFFLLGYFTAIVMYYVYSTGFLRMGKHCISYGNAGSNFTVPRGNL